MKEINDDILENIRYKTEEELTPEEETFLIKKAIKEINSERSRYVNKWN